MIHRSWHRVVYGVISAGLLALLIFVIQKSVKPLAQIQPEHALAAVDQTDSALVGWWKFDDGTGSTAANSGNSGSAGTISGTPSWTTSGAVNGALNFDGTSNVVETTAPSALSGSSVFTVTFWAKPSSLTDGVAVSIRSGTTDDSGFAIDPTDPQGGYGPAVYWPANGQLIKGSSSSLADGNWHFYTFVSRSATDHELFVDGVSVGTSATSKALASGLTNITIGAKYSSFGGAGFFSGGLDDVRVFSRALSTSGASNEMATLYALGPSSGGSQPSGGGGTGPYTLTVSKSGTGTGTVSGGSISCGVTCTQSNITSGTSISLAANADSGSTFAGWSGGGCSGTGTCSVTVSANTTVTATFNTSGGGGGGGGTTPVGGPGAGAHTIYVDQTLQSDCAGTYSIASRNCSGSDGYAYNTLQKASDNSSPGNTVALRAGTYHSVCIINQCSAVIINNSGTAGNLITYESYPGENAVLYGLGFSDADANGDGLADGPTNPLYREELVPIHGNYIYFKDIEITNAEGGGLLIDGSNDTVENVYSHDNWSDDFSIGFNSTGALTENDTLRNVEAAYSRHGAGIGYGTLRQSGVQPVRNITIEDSITYGNGFYLLNGVVTRVLPTIGDTQGGGNSWGIVADDSCSNFILPGYDSGCPNVVIKGVVSWTNVDSAFVPEGDTLLLNDIGFNNGLEGDGLKVFDYVPNLTVVGNIYYHNSGRGVELRVTSNGLFANNTVVDSGGFGIWGGTQHLYNNINWLSEKAIPNGPDPTSYDANSFCLNGEDCTNNLQGGNNGDPMFYNEKLFQDTSGNIVVNIPAGKTIAQRVQWMKDQFYNAFSVKPGSPALDAGKTYSYTDPISGHVYTPSYYCATPENQANNTCAMDIGAYEYQQGQVINPTPAPVQDTTAPIISQLAATSVTSSGATISWITNEGATTQIQYSTDTSYSQHTTQIATLTTSHSQDLTGLTPSTLYYYKVLSNDGSGNPQQQTGTFTTTAVGAPPVNTPAPNPTPTPTYNGGGGGGGGGGSPSYPTLTVSNVKVSGIPASGITVTWTTSNPATSQVQYGLTQVYGSQTFLDPTFVTSHSVKINGLGLNSVYHFQVLSKDPYGTLGTSADTVITISQAGLVSIATPIAATSTNTGANQGGLINSLPTATITGSVTGWLVLGATNNDVKTLQQILNASGYTVASSGTGSKGNEVSYFGPTTLIALEKFQCAKLAVCSGSPETTGYGATGPRTRAALNALGGAVVSTPVQSMPVSNPAVLPTGSITTWLLIGKTNAQVKTLQQILNAKGFTVSASGIGSPGHESTYFGPATSAALKKFQCAKLQVCSGAAYTTGYGATGPRTRAALSSQ